MKVLVRITCLLALSVALIGAPSFAAGPDASGDRDQTADEYQWLLDQGDSSFENSSNAAGDSRDRARKSRQSDGSGVSSARGVELTGGIDDYNVGARMSGSEDWCPWWAWWCEDTSAIGGGKGWNWGGQGESDDNGDDEDDGEGSTSPSGWPWWWWW